ncbi:hypothetical protein ACFVXA_34700 [Streptomyces sp. NPDC058246]|uniref:hypothetical protein n=1 Tax=Streptomyces sp. NPDC058246 TaxID=3346400 RepID=UPI0036E4981C
MVAVQKLPPSPVRDEPAVRVWRFVREPFEADTWRRVAYALLAFPLGVVCVPLALTGAPAGPWQRGLVLRFLDGPAHVGSGSSRGPAHEGSGSSRGPAHVGSGASEGPAHVGSGSSEGPADGTSGSSRGLAHAVLAAPLNLLVLAVTVYGWSLVPMNLGWPLRAGSDYADAWGGPTFAGAWAFHAIVGGIGFLLLMPWLGRVMASVQLRLAAALLS